MYILREIIKDRKGRNAGYIIQGGKDLIQFTRQEVLESLGVPNIVGLKLSKDNKIISNNDVNKLDPAILTPITIDNLEITYDEFSRLLVDKLIQNKFTGYTELDENTRKVNSSTAKCIDIKINTHNDKVYLKLYTSPDNKILDGNLFEVFKKLGPIIPKKYRSEQAIKDNLNKNIIFGRNLLGDNIIEFEDIADIKRTSYFRTYYNQLKVVYDAF